MSRRFQFSLRATLVALTVGCLWLGWKVDRARRRGEAIDAAADAGCAVGYLGASDLFVGRGERPNHFWADLKGIPVQVQLTDEAWSGNSLKPYIAGHLRRIEGIGEIWLPLRIGTWSTSFDETKQTDELRQMFRASTIKKVKLDR